MFLRFFHVVGWTAAIQRRNFIFGDRFDLLIAFNGHMQMNTVCREIIFYFLLCRLNARKM